MTCRKTGPCTRQDALCSCFWVCRFSDYFLIENEKFFKTFGFPSKKAARKICKDLESLRNNLANAEDIVTHDFSQVARIAQRIESVRSHQAWY